MPVKEEYHNVSVRLKDSDYQKLLFLHNKFSSMSYGKVTYADVLRISLTETFLRESKDPNNPVSNISKQQPQQEQEEQQDNIVTVEEVEKAVKENPVMLAKLAEILKLSNSNSNTLEDTEEAVTEETDASNSESDNDVKEEATEELTADQEEELKQYEIKWRNSKNKKNKPYSETYIQNQVNQKRKELAKTKYEKKIEE